MAISPKRGLIVEISESIKCSSLQQDFFFFFLIFGQKSLTRIINILRKIIEVKTKTHIVGNLYRK